MQCYSLQLISCSLFMNGYGPYCAEALVAATRETGLEISADKTKYMVMSRDQNAGRIHSVRMDNNYF